MDAKLRKWYERTVKFGTILVTLTSLACYILLQTGLLTDWKIIVGPAIGTVLGMIALVFDSRKAIATLEKNIDGLKATSAPRLLPLYMCQKDFSDELQNTKPGKK